MTISATPTGSLLDNSAPSTTFALNSGANRAFEGDPLDDIEVDLPQPRMLATVVGTLTDIGTLPPIPFEDPRGESES